MNTIIITMSASILAEDTIGLILYASQLNEAVTESFTLMSIEETMKINLN